MERSGAKRGRAVTHSHARGPHVSNFALLSRCAALSQLSYTVVGEQWKAEGSEEAAPQNDLFNGEWDQDAGDTVQKEVRGTSRQRTLRRHQRATDRYELTRGS